MLVRLIIETLERGVKYNQSWQYRHQNDVNSVFYTFFSCFYCWPWTVNACWLIMKSCLTRESQWISLFKPIKGINGIKSRLSFKLLYAIRVKKFFRFFGFQLQVCLTLFWRMFLSYRSQSIELLCKSMDWFLYNRNLHHERVNMYVCMALADTNR